jgi:hypothetical protein
LLVVGGVELEGGGGLIDRCAYDEEIRIMSSPRSGSAGQANQSEGYLQANQSEG